MVDNFVEEEERRRARNSISRASPSSSLGSFSSSLCRPWASPPPKHYKGKFIDFSYNPRTTLNGFVAAGNFEGMSEVQIEALKDLQKQHQLAGNYEDRLDQKAFYKKGEQRMFAMESILAQAKAKQLSISGDVKSVTKQAHKHSKTLTDCMIWFFAFGLIGLGRRP